MIDITVKPAVEEQPALDEHKTKPKPKSLNVMMLLIALIAFTAGYSVHYLPSLIPHVQPIQKSAYMLIITSEDMSAGQGQVSISQLVYQHADELGLELRRIAAGQGISNGEPWLQKAMEKHGKDSPCVVFIDLNGRMKCHKTPEDIEEMILLMKGAVK